MALIVNYKTKEGREFGVRAGSDDKELVKGIIERGNPGCTILSMETEQPPTDGAAYVSKFAESRAWKDVQEAKDKAKAEAPPIPQIVKP